jgi:hypothetical protein
MCYAGIPCPGLQPENHTNFSSTGKLIPSTEVDTSWRNKMQAVAVSFAEQDHVEHEVRNYVVRGLANLAHLACFKSTTTPYLYATACVSAELKLY